MVRGHREGDADQRRGKQRLGDETPSKGVEARIEDRDDQHLDDEQDEEHENADPHAAGPPRGGDGARRGLRGTRGRHGSSGPRRRGGEGLARADGSGAGH